MQTSDMYNVSLYNFLPAVKKKINLPSRVIIHDVTLRDGEQQAGIVFRKDEKIEIAKSLADAGVDRIEAGFPSVSPDDKQAIKEIARMKIGPAIYSFSRCMRSDVDTSLALDVDGIIMEIPSSDHLIRYGYGWSEEKAVELSIDATNYAHSHGLKVTFFTIDSTRARFDVISRLVGRVAEEGHMDSLALADTFGVLNPQATAYFVAKIKKKIGKTIEIHAHNDFGLAVANTIAALMAGAEIAHVTVNGIGERAGNTSLEELATTLELLYGVRTSVKLEKLRELSKLVRRLSHVEVPPQKPIVGDYIFTIESGIIAGWWRRLEKLNMPLEMYPFKPELVGHEPIRLILGKKSGKDSIYYYAEKMGIRLNDEQVEMILFRVKEVATKNKRPLSEEEIKTILSEYIHQEAGTHRPSM